MQGSTILQGSMMQGSMMMGGGGGGSVGGYNNNPQQPQMIQTIMIQQQQQNQMQQQQHGAVVRTPKPEDSATHITVSDPVQHSDGLNKYTCYRVEVRPPSENFLAILGGSGTVILPAVGPSPSAQQQQLQQPVFHRQFNPVLRRYSDFLWLHDKLQLERPGAIIPPVPDKQPMGRFSPQFVEDRRVQLERFLRRVAVHPELQDSAAFETFCHADDVAFQTAKSTKTAGVVLMNASTVAPGQHGSTMMPYGGGGQYGNNSMMQQPSPNKKGDGLLRWFAETKASITGDLVKSPDDDLFEEIDRYINGLDNQMKNISQQASGLVRKGKEIANGLFEFGLAFNLLGQSEADSLGSALTSMGETADRLSVLSAEHAERELLQFEEPLQDYIKIIHAVKIALKVRNDKRVKFSTSVSEVETKQVQLNKLRMQIGSEAKAYSTEMSLRRAQELADQYRDEFADCSQRVLREVDRFKREKAEDMRRTVLNYIQLQVEYNKKMEMIWSNLIPKLEQVQVVQQDQPQQQPQQQQTPPHSGMHNMTTGGEVINNTTTTNIQQQQQQQQSHIQNVIPASVTPDASMFMGGPPSPSPAAPPGSSMNDSLYQNQSMEDNSLMNVQYRSPPPGGL